MSSLIDYHETPPRNGGGLFDHLDGKGLVLIDDGDDKQINWNLTEYLASGETVSSAAYSDRGAVTSGKSVSSPTITFTITGYGYTEVTATLSTGRNVTRKYYTLPPEGGEVPSDYR
jgi:hypothetical protein